MSTYQKAGSELIGIADELIGSIEAFKWIKEVGVKIDFVWAYGARNEDGELIGDAIKHHGVRAFGLCRIIPLKERAKGNGDAEILVDKDWWDSVGEEERHAVVDHELTHLQPKRDADDLGRPKLKLRKHDFQFGWFTSVANRHGQHSQEQKQASSILDEAGQFYWPSLVEAKVAKEGAVTIKVGDRDPITMSHTRFSRISKEISKSAASKP